MPQCSYYKAFNAILEAANLDFRPYDFRHTAITRMLENPDVPLEVARAIAGHISDKMIRHYFHGRLSATRAAILAMGAPIAPPAELHNQDVLALLEIGLSAETVAAKIATSAGRFDTSLDALRTLKSAGVPDMVIRAMVKGRVGKAR
jgi:Phage integrase family